MAKTLQFYSKPSKINAQTLIKKTVQTENQYASGQIQVLKSQNIESSPNSLYCEPVLGS